MSEQHLSARGSEGKETLHRYFSRTWQICGEAQEMYCCRELPFLWL